MFELSYRFYSATHSNTLTTPMCGPPCRLPPNVQIVEFGIISRAAV